MVGEKRNLAIFEALTTDQDALIGMVEGNYLATSPHDLGKIVWPIVKETMAGANKNAMLELAAAARAERYCEPMNVFAPETDVSEVLA